MNIEVDNDFKKNVLVLGSRGFISKSVIERLLKDNVFSVKGISSSEMDLTKENQVISLIPDWLRSSTVIMTAAITRDKDDSLKAMLKNIKMCSNIAYVMNSHNVDHLIYISTIDVYGRENLVLPLSESSKLQPSNYYAISKLAGEFILNTICLNKQIPFTVLRLPTVYGPGDTHNSPIKAFLTSAVKREKIKIRGNGSKLMEFLYIKDVCEIVRLVILKKIIGVYNIVTGKSVSIDEILDLIENISKIRLNRIYKRENKNGSNLVFRKSALLHKVQKFNFTELTYGLGETYKYYYNKKNTV